MLVCGLLGRVCGDAVVAKTDLVYVVAKRHLYRRKPKGVTAKRRAAKKRAVSKGHPAIYALVDKRDGGICRVCLAMVGLFLIHRHHLRGRKVTTTQSVCHLCEECHGKTHVRIGGKTLQVSGDADQRDPVTGVLNGLTIRLRIGDSWYRTDGFSR